MLPVDQVECQQCRAAGNPHNKPGRELEYYEYCSRVVVSLQRFRNGRYRFRVDCEHCGCFSHYMSLGIEGAVAELVEPIIDKLREQTMWDSSQDSMRLAIECGSLLKKLNALDPPKSKKS